MANSRQYRAYLKHTLSGRLLVFVVLLLFVGTHKIKLAVSQDMGIRHIFFGPLHHALLETDTRNERETRADIQQR